ncbi:FKBP-type peptidyl-prolyl cis-trans isomerase [Paludisphaera rhizosphaerae]|uniref:FKBP-type peptidyl-prolyl cis-trans isomerase n=1 Tax=Paludisphaera rhizosphaerae TaxID=2711216 RepID=UPI001F0F9C14|nr:FKBP-type peptidyl-prolyl cis-trans isomerase [Paludisphaera rhizosphaerae]
MRRGLLGFLSLAVALAGCGEPGQIVPVMPPGATPVHKVDEKNAAEALGEQGARSSSSTAAVKGAEPYPPAPSTAIGETKTLTGDIQYTTLKEGTGEELKSGRVAKLHYVGTLSDGSQFDSSRDRGAPFEVTLGSGQLIKGWEYGIPGMKVGELRKLVIPPTMGYGAQEQKKIPANSTLIFEVELLEIK